MPNTMQWPDDFCLARPAEDSKMACCVLVKGHEGLHQDGLGNRFYMCRESGLAFAL